MITEETMHDMADSENEGKDPVINFKTLTFQTIIKNNNLVCMWLRFRKDDFNTKLLFSNSDKTISL